jgi:hypothetical protein
VEMFDRRPGEVAIRAKRRIVCSSPRHADDYGRHHLYLVERDVATLIPEEFAADFLRDPRVTRTDEDRGRLPKVLPPTDMRQAQRWVRGELTLVEASR